MRYELNKEQRDKINDARTNWQRYIGADGLSRGYMSVLWKRATRVIKELNKSLQDGKIDKAELQRIIAAWKG